MPKPLQIHMNRSTARGCDGSIVFAVYAPFGTDEILSVYPAGSQLPIQQQNLVKRLQDVAALGVNVSALIDLFEDDSYLVEIAAGKPGKPSIVSAWKQDMSAPQALAGFLRRVHARFPTSAIVLSLEGHGGAFLPDLDPARLTNQSITEWSVGGDSGTVRWTTSSEGTSFESDGGAPLLPVDSPQLPVDSPQLPASRMPMSTWAIGAALRSALKSGVPRPLIINFANCFNASVEVLHTVHRYADYATCYANYNFFTAGETYPKVFQRLASAGTATVRELAQWFALENNAILDAKQNHPTVGATVPLARMKRICTALDGFAESLTKELQTAPDRAAVRNAIQAAAADAQQYDTQQGFALEVPDQFMDIASFARRIEGHPKFAGTPIATRANALRLALAGLHQYGDVDRPYLDETKIWDFHDTDLALSIFFPDPDLKGNWDWRSPYYLSGKVDPDMPPAHRHVIDFLAERAGGVSPPWVAFIVEYHLGVKFQSFLPALAPFFPIFDKKFKPKYPPLDQGGPGTSGPRPPGKR
jgi:hypothetical protein